jgi:hypothetical protein
MTTSRDPDRLIHAFVREGAEQLDDQVYDVVRAEIDHKRQRVVIGPWRVPTVSKLVPIGLGAAAVIAVFFLGSQFIGSPSSNVGGPAVQPPPSATPSASPIGGTVEYLSDGIPATTEVTAIADGTSVSGTAVTTFGSGTHTVRLECAARDGDTWAFVGTTEQTTVPGERAGDWSAVVVRDGSPQQIGIVLSIAKAGEDCDAEWGSADMADIDANPVESGALVPPPDLAP